MLPKSNAATKKMRIRLSCGVKFIMDAAPLAISFAPGKLRAGSKFQLGPKSQLPHPPFLVSFPVIAVHPDGVEAAGDIFTETVTGRWLNPKLFGIRFGVETPTFQGGALQSLPGGDVQRNVQIAGEFDPPADNRKADALRGAEGIADVKRIRPLLPFCGGGRSAVGFSLTAGSRGF